MVITIPCAPRRTLMRRCAALQPRADKLLVVNSFETNHKYLQRLLFGDGGWLIVFPSGRTPACENMCRRTLDGVLAEFDPPRPCDPPGLTQEGIHPISVFSKDIGSCRLRMQGEHDSSCERESTGLRGPMRFSTKPTKPKESQSEDVSTRRGGVKERNATV